MRAALLPQPLRARRQVPSRRAGLPVRHPYVPLPRTCGSSLQRACLQVDLASGAAWLVAQAVAEAPSPRRPQADESAALEPRTWSVTATLTVRLRSSSSRAMLRPMMPAPTITTSTCSVCARRGPERRDRRLPRHTDRLGLGWWDRWACIFNTVIIQDITNNRGTPLHAIPLQVQ